MSGWKINLDFFVTGLQALVEEQIRLTLEKGSSEAPGYLTVDIYPEKDAKYPERHFGNWQFRFSDIAAAAEIILTVDKNGAKLLADGVPCEPSNVINGPLREDGLYTVYVVLGADKTYAEIDKARYSRLLSFGSDELDIAEHWPGSRRRSPQFLQPDYWMMRRLSEGVQKFAESLPHGAMVLDYGGGEADYFPYFAKCGAQYRNAEIYPGQLVDILCREGEPLPIDDATYDAAISIHVLEHTPDPRPIVAELYRVLKPGGRLFVGLPFAWERHHEPRDFWRFGRNGVEALFKDFASLDIQTDGNSEQALILLRNTHYYNTVKNKFLRDFLVRRGNRKYLKAAACSDEAFACNCIITATK